MASCCSRNRVFLVGILVADEIDAGVLEAAPASRANCPWACSSSRHIGARVDHRQQIVLFHHLPFLEMHLGDFARHPARDGDRVHRRNRAESIEIDVDVAERDRRRCHRDGLLAGRLCLGLQQSADEQPNKHQESEDRQAGDDPVILHFGAQRRAVR